MHTCTYVRPALLWLIALFGISNSLVAAEKSTSTEGLLLGIHTGPCFPNQQLTNVYNLATTGSAEAAYNIVSELGYGAGARVRLGLSGALSFSGGINYQRFPDQVLVALTEQGTTVRILTNTNVIPVMGGIHLRFLTGIVQPYASVHGMIVYQNTTVSTGASLVSDLLGPGQEVEPTVVRLGASAAAGIELSVIGIRPFFEVGFQHVNLVGAAANEQTKQLVMISLGLMF
jgi:hypothetical protein